MIGQSREARLQYAPRDEDEVIEAARFLKSAGYSLITTAAILRMDVAALQRLLGEKP
jgi:hypothetical protein